jgi:hypothetical protein
LLIPLHLPNLLYKVLLEDIQSHSFIGDLQLLWTSSDMDPCLLVFTSYAELLPEYGLDLVTNF